MAQLISTSVINDDNLGFFVTFLKNNPTEIVIKSYSCEQREDIIIKGKLFITKSFFFFINLKDKKIKSIIPLVQIDSIDIQNNALVLRTIKSVIYKLYNFRRVERTANFVVNFWSLSVRPRNYKLNMLKSICKNKTPSGMVSSSSLLGRSDDTNSSSSSFNQRTDQPNRAISHSNILENENTTKKESKPTKGPKILNNFSLTMSDSFAQIVSIASNIVQISSSSSDTVDKKTKSKKNIAKEISYTALIGYTLVLFLSISTYYVHLRMSKFPDIFEKYQTLQAQMVNCDITSQISDLSKGSNDDSFSLVIESSP